MKTSSVRRSLLAVSAAALAVSGIVLPTTSASAATGPDVYISRAYVAGGVTSVEAGDPVTFVFSARNHGPGAADLAIILVRARGIDLSAASTRISCVLPNGFVIQPDGDQCEPGFIRPSTPASSLVLNAVATGTSDLAVKACATDLTTSVDPLPGNNCRVLRVQLV